MRVQTEVRDDERVVRRHDPYRPGDVFYRYRHAVSSLLCRPPMPMRYTLPLITELSALTSGHADGN
ncbi:putative DNA polymerase B [Pseudomonas phage PIP]|nr:putative DNA polymerase B [Pseudomonas phage PIP]